MEQKSLGENIAKYRTEKGMSQEKVAEYLEVSRQAVTKWEANLSRPSTENLIRLSEIFGITVEELLGRKQTDSEVREEPYRNSKMPWLFIGITLLCIMAYIVFCVVNHTFHVGTLICMFIIGVPIQMFLHICFTYAIDKESFGMIAGFDSKTEYDMLEVKKYLTQLDIWIGSFSTVYVFLFSMFDCFQPKLGRISDFLNGFLLIAYVFNIIACILFSNYKAIDRLYIREADKKRARKSLPVAVVYIILLFLGVGIVCYLFLTRGIENNTVPAIRLSMVMLLGTGAATAGYFAESSNIKKWDPKKQEYRAGKAGLFCAAASILLFGAMFVV